MVIKIQPYNPFERGWLLSIRFVFIIKNVHNNIFHVINGLNIVKVLYISEINTKKKAEI